MAHATAQHEVKARGRQRQRTGRLSFWWVSLFTIVAAMTANLIARAVAFAVLPLPATFLPLMWQAVIMFTGIGVALACGVYALVRRFTRNAVRVYTVVAVIALILSLIPDLLILGDPVAFEPDTTIPAVWVMMGLHTIAAIVSTVMLIRLASPGPA